MKQKRCVRRYENHRRCASLALPGSNYCQRHLDETILAEVRAKKAAARKKKRVAMAKKARKIVAKRRMHKK